MLAWHKRCGVYCGARETVGGSSVSSGCWGEDSDHEYEQARHTPTLLRLFAYLNVSAPLINFILAQSGIVIQSLPARQSPVIFDSRFFWLKRNFVLLVKA